MKRILIIFLAAAFSNTLARAQANCSSGADLDPSTKAAVQQAAESYAQQAIAGDVQGLRSNAAPALASGFSSVESAINANKNNFASARATTRNVYVLDQAGSNPKGEFFCGVINSGDYTAFQIPNLAAGRYAIAVEDVRGGKSPLMISEILQQQGSAWKLAGFYLRQTQVGGHDANWYLQQARDFKAKNEPHIAWLYYLTAWQLQAPLTFMSNGQLDKIADEAQHVRPADLPTPQSPLTLNAGGKNFEVTSLEALPVGDSLDLVVRYKTPSIADTRQTFAENMSVMKAVVDKYPEYRQAFNAVVARAVDPSGQDYGSMMEMAKLK